LHNERLDEMAPHMPAQCSVLASPSANPLIAATTTEFKCGFLRRVI
jgi:hypothetical protein